MSIEIVSKLGMGNATLDNCPINPDWILEGRPIARSKLIAWSSDCAASSYIWDCTAGRFNWHYESEETIYFLEGSVIIKDNNGVIHRLSAGDTISFPCGVAAEWQVDNYVRKVAFIRSPLPRSVQFGKRALTFLKRPLGGGAKPAVQPALFQRG
jgi:uncharacterized cupin superfamily protein